MSLPPLSPEPILVYSGEPCSFNSYEFGSEDTSDPPVFTPRDLSGWTFLAYWRVYTSSVEFLPLTVDASGASAGVLGVSCDGPTTALMKRGGVWDLQGTFGGVVETLLRGETKWTLDVTR